MDLKTTYDKIANDWFNDHKESDWWIADTSKFLSYLKPGDRILDVGCGAGLKTKYLIEKGFSVVGIDFSEEMIRVAKKYYPEGEFYVKDIKEPLGLDIFDGIFAQAVLLHISKSEVISVLEGLKKSLKENGYLYLAVKEQKSDQKDEQVIKEDDYGYEYERFFSFFTLPEIKKYLSQLKMEVVYENTVINGNTNWVVVIAKN